MKQRILLHLLLVVSFGVVISCSKDNSSFSSSHSSSKGSDEEFGETIVLGEQLNNPYSISIMQVAYDSLIRTKYEEYDEIMPLEPNCLYVRFRSQDSSDVATLQNLDIDLFEYPLDYDILVEGDSYHDPDIPEEQITWQYSVVSTDFVFPAVEYEILDACYIPNQTDEDSMDLKVDPTELELLAIRMAELPEKYQPVEESKAKGVGKKPEGTIKVMNDDEGVAEPMRGVMIRCHYFVNISSGYTNEYGYYKVGHRYLCNPHYAIVFRNTKGFVIWGNYAFIAAANHSRGYHSNAGYSTTIQTSSSGWKWAVINNAAYDYYRQCVIEGMQTLHTDLRIWCWPRATSSSTPMLHHLLVVNFAGIASQLVSCLITGEVTPTAMIISAASMVVSLGLPDMTIGMSREGDDASPHSGYREHYHTVWHELSHASHFRKAGETVWGPYINYIVTHNGYGDGSSTSTGRNICELGESWAYANEYYKVGIIPSNHTSEWFFGNTISIYHMLSNGILTRKQMYNCLTSDVKSINDYKEILMEKYPTKAAEIDAFF